MFGALTTAFISICMLLITTSNTLTCQSLPDSLYYQTHIATYTGATLADKARKFLYTRIERNSPEEIFGLLNYMQQRPDGAGWLAASEQLRVRLFAADYALVADSAELQLLLTRNEQERELSPHNDGLADILHTQLRNHAVQIMDRFDENSPTEPQRIFFNILLNGMVIEGYRAQEKLNTIIGDFHAAYPESYYSILAERYFRKSYAEAPIGAAFTAGYGAGFFTGALGTQFSDAHGPVLGGEFYLHRITLAGNLLIGGAQAPNTFVIGNDNWEQGKASFINTTLDIGYEFRAGLMGITPMAGVALQSLSEPDNVNSTSTLLETGIHAGYDAGLLIGYRIPFDTGPHIDLRIRGGYANTSLGDVDGALEGGFAYLHILFALVQRPYAGARTTSIGGWR